MSNVMQNAWQGLLNDFDRVPAPAECASIRDNYRTCLTETGSMMIEVSNALTQAGNDPQGALKALFAMKGQSESRVGAPARNADQGVGSVCGKYGVSKWFSIHSDAGDSSVLSRAGV